MMSLILSGTLLISILCFMIVIKGNIPHSNPGITSLVTQQQLCQCENTMRVTLWLLLIAWTSSVKQTCGWLWDYCNGLTNIMILWGSFKLMMYILNHTKKESLTKCLILSERGKINVSYTMATWVELLLNYVADICELWYPDYTPQVHFIKWQIVVIKVCALRELKQTNSLNNLF